MFSYINLFISFVILLQNDFDINFNLKNNIYCLIITAFVLAYTTQGFISLLVVSIGISKFPIIIISSFLLLLTILVNESGIASAKTKKAEQMGITINQNLKELI